MDVITDVGGEAAVRAVRRAASEALGRAVAVGGTPEVIRGSFGRGAYGCRLEPGAPPPWDRGVVVRVASPTAAAREAAWHAFLAGRGYPVPPVLGVVDLADATGSGGASGGGAAIVLGQGPELSLMESLGRNPIAIPQLLRAMAEAHARLHQVPVDGAPAAAAGEEPLAALDRDLDATGLAADFAPERAWLDGHAPPAGSPAVCHGDLQPAAMRLDGVDTTTSMLVNWSAALVADAEYDVALTLLMFWSAPYLAEGLGQRKMLKTVRDMITDGYRAAYEGAAGSGPLDEDRLRYWGAFHALRWSVALAVADRRGAPADAWDPVGLVQHGAAYRKDLGRRFARLTRRQH
jgi:Phosphotransferase enzyme family